MAFTNLCEELISSDIKPSCDNPIVNGVEPIGVIINRSDIDFPNVVYNATRKTVIESLPLKVGKKGYAISIPSNTPFAGTDTNLTEGTNSNKFTSNVGFVILNNDPDVTEKIIAGLANGTYVVVIQNKYNNKDKATTPSDSVHEVYGMDKGLRASALGNDKYSADTDGGWSVVLTEKEHPTPAYWLYDTDYATTATAFEALTDTATS
jgi:hypothetical protein